MLRSTSLSFALIGLLGTTQLASAADKPVVVMETSEGTITIELDPSKAPKTVENFLGYTDAKYYDGLIFHRVIADFMIQGGGFSPDLAEKPAAPPIKNESKTGLSNLRGTIAMARTPNPDSATCQFFINAKDNSRSLDRAGGGYTAFGKVIDGMDVVDKIRNVATETKSAPDGKSYDDVPKTPVVIKSVRRKK